MRDILKQHILLTAVIAALTLGLTGCNLTSGNSVVSSESSLSNNEKTLTIITSPSMNTYYESKDGADGMEFQLINKFAAANGYQLKIVLADKEEDVLKALDRNLADIALIGKPLSISKQQNYLQTQPYMDVTSQLIYRHGQGKPESFEDLTGKRVLVQDNEQNREKYWFLRKYYKELNWEFSDRPFNELLGLVNTGKIDAAIINSHDYLSKRSLFTRTRIAFDIYYPEPISLALSNTTDEALRNSLNTFFDQAHQDGTIENLVERFYGHADDFDPRGSRSFFNLVRTRLPEHHETIKRIAKEYKLDWRLLAAISFQESHWDPLAKSPTGVRGLMMLTQGTARDMGIEDRLDPEESLRGGARYFKKVRRQLPESILEPDRTWFALAAYNVGIGHLLDARKITDFHGGNPNSWADVKDHLPLLENEDWYQYTDYGYARGTEPVNYVQNIRHISSLLEWRFPRKNDTIMAANNSNISVKNLDQAIREARTIEKNAAQQNKPLKLSSLFL